MSILRIKIPKKNKNLLLFVYCIAKFEQQLALHGIPIMLSITTLEAICKAFGITISEFFAEGELIEVSDDTRELLNYLSTLSQRQKENLLNFIKNFDK